MGDYEIMRAKIKGVWDIGIKVESFRPKVKKNQNLPL